MRSIVVHYKELALKGKNRSWFIRMLVRNLQLALAGLHVAAIRQVMGRIEIELGAETRLARGPRPAARRCSASPTSSPAGRGPHDLDALAAAILGDLGDRAADSFRVTARRTDKRFPFTSPQIEREVGGRIKQAKGWRVDLDRCGAHRARRHAAGRGVLLFRQGPGRRRPADGHRRPGRVSAVGRHRLAGRGVSIDAPRLLGAADSLSQLPDPLARLAGESAGDRRAPDPLPAAFTPAAGAVRRACSSRCCWRSGPSCAS